ncbi:unnamed protein product [Chrysodeixis includens]|uniref:Uncharacterized protein n=1 Tax=Chrysodeixis includens TaxID=689277 RepID=A0A9N8L4S1_CHRIL|nr:unnamed protein product [Chrysodeixis includens]
MGGESNSAGEVDTSGEYAVDNEKVKQNYDAVLYKVLRTSNIITDASGDKKPSSYHSYDRRIERKREEIEEAIRERCQARVECTEKCSRENALRERYCPKSCKAVFDYLVKCPPTRFEKKHNPPPPKDSCSSDSCASKNSCDGDACKSTKDSCDGDSCRSKDSCDGDSCKSKDSCGDSDSCNPTTSKRPYGKTFPPRRWTNNKYD